MSITQLSRTSSFAGSVWETNKTLRNTFALLGLSMIPTIIGIIVGMQINISKIATANPIMFIVAMLAAPMILMHYIKKNSASSSAIFLMFGLAGFMGLIMSLGVSHYISQRHGSQIVLMAAAGTIVSLFSCSVYAMTTKRDFSKMAGMLLGGVIALIVLTVINMFLNLTVLFLLVSFASVLIFSAFLVYDVQSIVNGGETNYVLATVNIYLDVINIFTNLMNLIGMGFGSSND